MLAPAPTRTRRLDVVDAVRGIALVGMFVYHLGWDLGYVELVGIDVGTDPGWRLFATGIITTFLGLVGVGLVLATRLGFRRHAFLRRLVLVGGGAALVTAGTYLVMPQSYVFFGVLHHITVASVLALPFLRLPAGATALAAAGAFALGTVRLPIPSWLAWTGLTDPAFGSGDFVPLFPWFGCVLAGIALARFALRRGLDHRLAALDTTTGPWRALAVMGRHSLLIYLLHQPVLIAVVWTIAVLVR